jgi:hypothetical protein
MRPLAVPSLLCWASLAITVAACERKAPGPDECRRLAIELMGIPPEVDRLPPQIMQQLDALTVECITQPYDRALMRCVEAGRGTRRCMAEYRLRTELEAAERANDGPGPR